MSNPFAIPNDKPISHLSHNGTEFHCARADLKEPIIVKVNGTYPPSFENFDNLVRDVAEFIGFHASNIRSDLTNGFSGYDTLRFKYEKIKG